MVARSTPDRKVGGSIPSRVRLFGAFCAHVTRFHFTSPHFTLFPFYLSLCTFDEPSFMRKDEFILKKINSVFY